ncbi:hydrogenase formation protein HypD [Methylacidiphilum caldifontis]|uniref:Hydrogenase formation protein HypD n=1 Tax=Methylacidiphilum caldifontis TaxID=2795386 RepID=A0A4Y8PHU3_9BACT|nr:hydrogenase formation protein HypD [Methylacidiphilum caldifontis]TFE70714.1 hydrogenase formation protein HypD [Methylacidiphilum caldifontis]
MQFVDEFRNKELIQKTAQEIARRVDPKIQYRIMEVCGGHTFSIYRFGLHELLPPNIELIHGPGCPVCVLPIGRIDEGMSLANDDSVILTAFGDMMRVPGKKGSPLELKAKGRDIRMIYSPLDNLKLAIENRDKKIVFFAIGFETTAPSTALTLIQAKKLGIKNFFVFSNHVLIVPAIRAILDSPDMRIDGFIGPGHVSTVIGCQPYEFISKNYRKPIVISGFEPLDLLESILKIVQQLQEGRNEVENQYNRVVRWEGNRTALKVIQEVFELRPYFEWRGLGFISQSALKINKSYAQWDAEEHFQLNRIVLTDPKSSQCGEVLKGVLKPYQCKLFGKVCNPEHPVGALMVSSEGACAAYYQHTGRKEGITDSL